ncbi:cell wall hydrolase [Anaerosacchariphilus sp. NSJ-68]|uniref:Cell wall hydrolase n=1 Tax=Anaerosacchariphilus hominis TaxID=2763017 RepID=A0A923LDG3_9FIRM|nr:cell wall hydrolase [Anaerosacchariphilus hominis]
MLGLAGMLLMVSADTKDVEAKISYESEVLFEDTKQSSVGAVCPAAGGRALKLAAQAIGAENEVEIEIETKIEAEIQAEETAGLSPEDYDALLRIVEAEASGEDETGRLLVANVVLNRVRAEAFPDTIQAVVYQTRDGRAQFSPVGSGKIERVIVSDTTRIAVERALAGEDVSGGALYFVNPSLADAGALSWFRENLTLVRAYHDHEFYL